MSHLEKDFLRYLRIKELLSGKKIIHRGGVIEKIKIGDHSIEYDIDLYNEEKSDELFAVATERGNNTTQPCFMMSIIPGGDSVLISLNRGVKCFGGDHDQSSDIVLAALEIAKLKGAKTFEFTDNSTKTIEGKKIQLSNLSFLTTGKTWYERILPIKMSKEESRYIIETLRADAISNNWRSISNSLLKQGIETSFDTTGINIDEAGSAMKVLERAKNSKKYHRFFFECMNELLIASFNPEYEKIPISKKKKFTSDIPTLHGESWKMAI